MTEVAVHEEKGSEFVCYYQGIQSLDDVQQGLTKMKMKHRDAAHIVTAYRLSNPLGPYNQGYKDDKENGAGWLILDELKKQRPEEHGNFHYQIHRWFEIRSKAF